MPIIKAREFLFCEGILVPLIEGGDAFIPSSKWSRNRKPEHNVVIEITDVKMELIEDFKKRNNGYDPR